MIETTFYADLHVHSRFSRATSRDCNLRQLSYWARKKGIAVVGTGDFTHPQWLEEIKTDLVPAEPGLFALKPDLERQVTESLPPSFRTAGMEAEPRFAATGPTRFMLQVEISTIYKKDGRTRKAHHVVFVPGIKAAEKFAALLSRIGNLKSDGRPILGLDSRDLLEIVLEVGDGAWLAPAHVWTPWFSALGSKSGFDSIEACYGDLAGHIFAIETGLSSDPPMNWRVSGLDKYRLISNSDAHSPGKLGRECCVFDCAPDYFAMRKALETGNGYGGTIEFFPEEGKYHMDGHRKCGVRLTPEETREKNGRCPVCGKPLTLGVMYRVCELADRPDGARPAGAASFRSLVPLREVLSEILHVGAASSRVEQAYEAVLARFGPELFVLNRADVEQVRSAGHPQLAEALGRIRDGRVIRDAGYDGEYGRITVFMPGEHIDGTGALGFESAPAAESRVKRCAKGSSRCCPRNRTGCPS